MHEILLGLTTTPASDWRRKINEIIQFDIKKIALFPTFLPIEERKELYVLLDTTGIEEIPHIHLRGQDMEKWELEMFINKYKTQFFNVHLRDVESPVLKEYEHMTYMENSHYPFNEDKIKICAGICLDISHCEEGRIWKNSTLDPLYEIIDRYPIGCCHVSAVKLKKLEILNTIFGVSRHTLKALNEVDYVAKYKKYLPRYISLELQNSFEQQLEIKKHLEKKLGLV
jgi:hypothetical protein